MDGQLNSLLVHRSLLRLYLHRLGETSFGKYCLILNQMLLNVCVSYYYVKPVLHKLR